MKNNFFNCILLGIIFSVLSISTGNAETLSEDSFPKLPKQSEKLADFVPDFWIVEYLKQDDLNNDGQLDTVMVVKNQEASKVIRLDSNSDMKIDTNERMLIVLFAEDKMWKLIKQNTTLIPKVSVSSPEDPFNGVVYGYVDTKNHTLSIRIGYFENDLGSNTSTFRWQNNDFYLIGYDTYSRHRATGEETTTSYNFLTNRQNIITETPVEDENSDVTIHKSVWKNLKKRLLLKLDKIRDADIDDYLMHVSPDD